MTTNSLAPRSTALISAREVFFGVEELVSKALSFLGPKELAVAECVCRFWRQQINEAFQEELQCGAKGLIPPDGITYKQLFILFRNALGRDVIQKHIGKVEAPPPIPRRFIEMALHPDPFGNPPPLLIPRHFIKDHFTLVFIPEYITLTVDENSPYIFGNSWQSMILWPASGPLFAWASPAATSASTAGARRSRWLLFPKTKSEK